MNDAPAPEEERPWSIAAMYAWFDKRKAMADAFGVEPSEVPAEAVWFLAWPQPLITQGDIDTARRVALRMAGPPPPSREAKS